MIKLEVICLFFKMLVSLNVKLQRAGCQYDEKNASSQSREDSNERKQRVQKGLVKV